MKHLKTQLVTLDQLASAAKAGRLMKLAEPTAAFLELALQSVDFDGFVVPMPDELFLLITYSEGESRI